MNSQPIQLLPISQQAFIEYHKRAGALVNKQWNLRENMRQIDLAYLRELDLTKENQRGRIYNKVGQADKFQNITVPIVKPQVRAAVTYQVGIFVTDYPIFGVVADPQFIDSAKMMQAVIEDQSVRGAWARELILFFFDGFKYNFSAIECWWDQVVTPTFETVAGVREADVKNVIWEGNCLKRWDPYNTYFDCRVDLFDIPTKGDFVGRTELLTKIQLKTLISRLPGVIRENIKAAFESPSLLGSADLASSYNIPVVNPNALLEGTALLDVENWVDWAQNLQPNTKQQRINYKGLYEVSTEYVRILPSDFRVRASSPNTPQIWKLIIVNHSVIILAERQTNAHDKIPVFFGAPSEDGLSYQTKSMAQDGEPFQSVSTALMNSIVHGRRRAITDRVLYDPSRIDSNQINNSSANAKIPVRPSAYGKPVSEAVYPFPYRDDQAGLAMQEIQGVKNFSDALLGQNPARQGQFVKGNKTDQQWNQTMAGSTSSDQLAAIVYESQVFTPLKEVIKYNILQYQGESSIYSKAAESQVEVDPVKLRKAVLNFKVTDGLLTSDKVMSGDTLKTAAQIIGSSPFLAKGYNVAPLFSYMFKVENVNFKAFEKSPAQIAYEDAMAAWQNVATMAAQKGTQITTPQPKPQDYGYDPNTASPANQGVVAVSRGGVPGGTSNSES